MNSVVCAITVYKFGKESTGLLEKELLVMSQALPASAKRYVKLPVTITAVQWDGTEEASREIVDWIDFIAGRGSAVFIPGRPPTRIYNTSIENPACIVIGTAGGNLRTYPTDWVVQGVTGEFYPCSDDIFVKVHAPEERGLLVMPPLEPRIIWQGEDVRG